MKKKIISLALAVSMVLSIASCGSSPAGENTAGEGTESRTENSAESTKANQETEQKAETSENEEAEHEPITMTAMVPFRNPSHLADLVHEKYPEINIEFQPYSGYNGSAYSKALLYAGEVPDIYIGSLYSIGTTDVSDTLIDLSVYPFSDNFTDQRLREVTEDGSIYMLPLYYSCLAITYNKTLLEKHGWELPNNLDELEALAKEVKEAGCNLALDPMQFPGSGFQYLFNILSTGYVNTLEGRKWQRSFLAQEADFEGNEKLMEDVQVLNRWRDMGMLNGDADPDNDTKTKAMMAEGNTLFMMGNVTAFTEEETTDEFAYMPYLSKDGDSNVYIANVTKYVGLSKKLEAEGNEQKLEDALHVMEVLCTVEGMRALSVNVASDVLIPLKEFVIPEDSTYKPIEDALNNGQVAPLIYGGWEHLVVPVGEKMFSFMRGECEIEDVIKELDSDEHLIVDNTESIYTTVTEKVEIEDCARLVGICFAKASGADLALVSTNKWFPTDEDIAMNTRGVQCPLYAMPITDEEVTAMIPTGWTGTIQTVTLSGARIKELAETGYDKYEDGERLFPYHLILPDGFTLEDDTTYTVAICGASKEVQEEGNIQDTGIVGLEVVADYLSQFETFSAKDISWE